MKFFLDRKAMHEGRLSQQAYVLMFTLPFLATLALTASMFINDELFAALGVMGIYGVAFGWLLLMAFGDALNIKRYHDLGHPGRLYRLCRPGIVVLPLLAFVLDFFIPAQMASVGDIGATIHLINEAMAPTLDPAPFALLAITAAAVAMNVLYLSIMPGQRGPNEYGPSPAGGAAIPGAASSAPSVVRSASDENDPVTRALADYRARQAAAAACPTPASVAKGAAPPGTFGKKRR